MSRRMDIAEALANAGLGLLLSWSVTYWVFPLMFGLAPSAGQSAAITALFFVLSALRSYVLRRIFRGWS